MTESSSCDLNQQIVLARLRNGCSPNCILFLILSESILALAELMRSLATDLEKLNSFHC